MIGETFGENSAGGFVMRALLIGLAIVWAAGAMAQVASPEQKRQLVEQKIKLLEMLLNSPTAKTSGSRAASATLAERGRWAIEMARSAAAESRFDDAAQLLDEALKSSSAESRRLKTESALSEGALRQTYQNLREQVATYRASVAELSKEAKAGGAARNLLGRIDAMSANAGKQEGLGRLPEANRILSDAYKLAVAELSNLRAGQEVVMSLNFATPADEYAYEQKRFESGEMMVGMMVGEGRAVGERRVPVDAYVNEGRRLKTEATRLAGEGRHKEAVGLMEQATGQINRALQSMGVPAF